MKVVVIGGSGHIGTFLVPRLVRAGHDVVNVSRGRSSAYAATDEWKSVQQIVADREQEDCDGTFAQTVLRLQPQTVVDLVCFTAESSAALVNGLRGKVGHLVHCGSIWRYGPSKVLPIDESMSLPPFDTYGVAKERIALELKAETAAGGLPSTSLHPGHIVGPGWAPIGPLGNFDLDVWRVLSAGEPLRVPGMGTQMLHHVHADDVAQAFQLAIENADRAAGEDFNIVAPHALSVRGFAEIAADWFGRAARIEHVSWDEFRKGTTPELAEASWGHLHRSHCFSIEKARSVLGYAPRYESEAAVVESLRHLIETGALKLSAEFAPGRSAR
jgi:nucleoside-diphosphate-sugar epimerase